MKKIKAKGFGTYSNEGLGKASEINSENQSQMHKIVQGDLTKIKEDFIENIMRLNVVIKSDIGTYPKAEEFAKWFFDKKKIYQWGKSLPEITDEEIIENAKLYTKEFREKIKSKNKISQSTNSSIVLKNANFSIQNLVDFFLFEVFKPNVLKEDIKKVFSFPFQTPKSTLNLNISNKKFIFLLNQMQDENLIATSNLFDIIGRYQCFKSDRGTILKRGNLDQAKHQLKSKPLAKETEETLKILVKNIKK